MSHLVLLPLAGQLILLPLIKFIVCFSTLAPPRPSFINVLCHTHSHLSSPIMISGFFSFQVPLSPPTLLPYTKFDSQNSSAIWLSMNTLRLSLIPQILVMTSSLALISSTNSELHLITMIIKFVGWNILFPSMTLLNIFLQLQLISSCATQDSL